MCWHFEWKTQQDNRYCLFCTKGTQQLFVLFWPLRSIHTRRSQPQCNSVSNALRLKITMLMLYYLYRGIFPLSMTLVSTNKGRRTFRFKIGPLQWQLFLFSMLFHCGIFSFAESIQHCIIGETFFITSSPILGAFYNNEKNYFVYCYWTGYFLIMSKLNHLFNGEKFSMLSNASEMGG